MRAALLSLLAASTLVAACKIDLDEANFRQCKDSTSAPTCLDAVGKSDFAWLQENVFTRNCSSDDCHGQPSNGQQPGGRLNLSEGLAYRTLMGGDDASAPLVASEIDPRHNLVEPGNPEASYLFFILKGLPLGAGTSFQEPPDDIGYMPQQNETLCCQKLDAVHAWILAGAKP